MAGNATTTVQKKNPLREIVQPFIDLVHAPRALWGINLSYLLEGLVYFGMLNYLTIHFSDYIFRGVDNADVHSHHMVAPGGGLPERIMTQSHSRMLPVTSTGTWVLTSRQLVCSRS